MFLDSDFKDISKFCMRMEKNIVEGDGVDAVIWAGKISELITHYISNYVNLDLREFEQNKKLRILLNKELIPEKIYDQLDSIRQYRNIATHHDLNNEIHTAMKVHRMIFNIVCWFYGVYKADDSYFTLKYPGVTYKHDEDFINKLKNNLSLNQESSKISLSQHNVDYNVHDLFNQNNVYYNEDLGKYTAYITDNDKKITIGHFKTKEVAVRKGLNFVLGDDFKIYKYLPIKPEKLENGRYSDRKGIDYDEDEELWTAKFNNTDLGYFISQNSAIIARKEYIDTLPLPVAKNGSYSDYKEITFDLNHKLWCIKKDGEIFDYYDSEEEAIYNLTQVLNINIPLEKLGIVKDEGGSIWRIYYKNKYVATCDSEKEAINKRLEYVSSFAQPKRNKDGLFSIHKGIFYDEKNLIWVLRIKGELLGFFDSEEDAFNFKKEFLKSKGLDVSNFIFHEEESFDDDFDFKVKINSEENAIVYNEENDEWIVHFRGNEIDRCKTELDAKHSRIDYLKSMPYPPRKADGRYSLFEGIDYDINRHLWTAEYNDESIGYYDSEEDAFYALKDYLVKEGIDVSEMHFRNPEKSIENEEDCSLISNEDLNGEVFGKTNSENKNRGNIDFVNDESNEKKFISYYDIFKDKDDSPGESIIEEKDLDKFNEDLDIENNEISLQNIEDYKKSLFYGIANKSNDLNASNDISIYDLESDDEENEFIDDIDMEKVDSEISDRFSMQKNKDLGLTNNKLRVNAFNLNLGSNRKDYKEIRFNSYDSNGFRREMILSYNAEELFFSLEGMIEKDELKGILSNNYFNNTHELNYKKEDKDLFSIFINLHYDLESISLEDLLDIFTKFSWNFDLLSHLFSKDEVITKSIQNNVISEIFSVINSKSEQYPLNVENTKNEFGSKPKDYLKDEKISRRRANTKQENFILSKSQKSNSKAPKAIIRGGVRVSLEEAEQLDNAKEEKEIKSTIIYKKPERVKEYRTTSLGNVLELNRNHNDKDEIEEEYEQEIVANENDISFESESVSNKLSDSNLTDDNLRHIDLNGHIVEENSIDDGSDDDFINESLIETFNSVSDGNNLNEEGFEDNFDYGDIVDGDESGQIISFDDIFDDEDESSFEDELDNYSIHNSSDSVVSEDEVSLDGFDSSENDLGYDLTTNDSDKIKSSKEEEQHLTKKVKKPKKPKKEKKIPEDAFDDKYKNSYEIEYDDENDKWLAYIGGNLIKSFDTPKEAVIERKKLLRRNVSIPRKGLNGKYSDEKGIDFDLKERIWTGSVNGIIVIFATNEKDAVLKRKIFVSILNKLEIDQEDFNEDKLNEIKSMDLEFLLNELTDEDFKGIGFSPNEVNKKFQKI